MPAHFFFWDVANSFSVKETIFYAGLKTECDPLELCSFVVYKLEQTGQFRKDIKLARTGTHSNLF